MSDEVQDEGSMVDIGAMESEMNIILNALSIAETMEETAWRDKKYKKQADTIREQCFDMVSKNIDLLYTTYEE